jgi:DNA-binding NtrC family response regulator
MARIILIEDDETLRPMLAQSLRLVGHFVVEARTGREAESMIRVDVPDLVVTDIVMPDQDGIGVIMMIQQEFPKTPVIVMSGGRPNTLIYLDIAQKLGAKRLLEKPFTPGQLNQAVADVLASL